VTDATIAGRRAFVDGMHAGDGPPSLEEPADAYRRPSPASAASG
jgi:hypothetical protein